MPWNHNSWLEPQEEEEEGTYPIFPQAKQASY